MTCTGQRTKRRTRRLPIRESHISVFSRPVHALRRVHADVVPFLSALWTSAVAGASPRGEETPSRCRTEPRSTFRRSPAKESAIPQTGMPSTVPAIRGERPSSDFSLPESPASVPRSRRPHFFPRMGTVPSRALQAPECGHPRSLVFEEQAPLLPTGRSFRISRAWD